MDILTNEKLMELAVKSGGPCVSIYLPTFPLGREAQQGSIRLRNQLKNVEEELSTAGLRTPDIQTLIEPAEKLLIDGEFWQYQSDGLAFFLSPAEFYTYRLPIHFQELAIVNERFYLKPLLPMFTGDGKFFVLAISQNKIRLLRCTRYITDEIPLQGIPTSRAEALKFDDPERQLQFHTSTSTPHGSGKRSALFHGHGVGVDDNKADLLRYFHKVDEGLQQIFRNEKAPLVFAGVEYLFPIYREANSYNHLLDAGIEGNADDWNAEELHQQAWKIVEPMFTQVQNNALAGYRELAEMKSTKASRELQEIVPAAYGGRVDTLFVDVNAQQWGSFNPQTNQVQLHETRQADDEDLLDFAATQTIINRGIVYAIQPEELPENSPIAAIFRY